MIGNGFLVRHAAKWTPCPYWLAHMPADDAGYFRGHRVWFAPIEDEL